MENQKIFAKFSFRPMADPSTPQPRHRALINRTVLRWHFNNNNLENLIKHCLACVCVAVAVWWLVFRLSQFLCYIDIIRHLILLFFVRLPCILCVCVCAIVHNGNLNGNCRLNKFCPPPLAPLPRAFLVRWLFLSLYQNTSHFIFAVYNCRLHNQYSNSCKLLHPIYYFVFATTPAHPIFVCSITRQPTPTIFCWPEHEKIAKRDQFLGSFSCGWPNVVLHTVFIKLNTIITRVHVIYHANVNSSDKLTGEKIKSILSKWHKMGRVILCSPNQKN